MRRVIRIITALALPAPVLLACEVLLQWHGWGFWAGNFDATAGPGLSVVLAVLAASWWATAAWSRGWAAKAANYGLGVTASLVLLAGPLFQVTAPLVRAQLADGERASELAGLDAAIVSREVELAKYINITETGRRGWFGLIEDTRGQISALRTRRATLAASAPEVVSEQRWVMAGLHVAALVLLQVGAASMAAQAGRRLRAARETSDQREDDMGTQRKEREDSARAKAYKGKLIQMIHVAKSKLAMDDDTYRGLLQEVGGSTSSKAMPIKQLEAVLAHMQSRGFEVKSTHKGKDLIADPQSKLIRHLWLELHRLGAVSNPSEEALAAFVKRQTRVESLAWLSTYQASTVIESLKQWLARAEEQAGS